MDKEDIMGQLGQDLNAMTDSLAKITRKIATSTDSMMSMTDKVKSFVGEQNTGVSDQAAAINEITSSLEEIDKSSKQTMSKSQALKEETKATREQGQLGTEAVKQSIEGMVSLREKVQIIAQTIMDLNGHTQQIGEITTLVNRLAQQSKMLALNASIEAAKAGEAGKGFAVVATEVKNLAEQSENATSQVQKILEDIRVTTDRAVLDAEEGTKTVDVGSALIEKTGTVIAQLSEMIDKASISSQQIEAAIRQENVGIEQIASAMGEINKVTISIVHGINEITEATSQVAELAASINAEVNIYKT